MATASKKIKADPGSAILETPPEQPIVSTFRSAFGPGFLALFWGGIALWGTGMLAMVKMSS